MIHDWPESDGSRRETADVLRVWPPLVFCFLLGVAVTLAVVLLGAKPNEPSPPPPPCRCDPRDRDWLRDADEASDGCVCPPGFDCVVSTCVCRVFRHGATIDEVELRCGDELVTYVQPIARP